MDRPLSFLGSATSGRFWGAMRLAVATALGLAAMELVAAAPAPIIRTHLYPHEMAPVQEMDVDSGSGDVGNPGRTSGGTLMLATGTTQYTGPAARDQYDEWAAALEKDRDTQLTSIGYDGGAFDKVPWTQTSYIQVQAHPFDRYFYDPVSGKYTVKRFLDDLKTRYGGIDSVLLWPTYPNIGVDDRDQFDYFRMMPGGLAALKKATGELKAAGVNVLWGYNPWDTGTRRETDSDEDTLASMLKQTDGDGFNGDTMVEVPEKFLERVNEDQSSARAGARKWWRTHITELGHERLGILVHELSIVSGADRRSPQVADKGQVDDAPVRTMVERSQHQPSTYVVQRHWVRCMGKRVGRVERSYRS